MIYIFISVFIVLVLMNVFIMLILHQMVKSTGRQIEKDAGRMLAVYDELIEKKSVLLNELDNKEQELKAQTSKELSRMDFSNKTDKAAAVHNSSVSLKAVPFHDATYSNAYKRIKEGFSVDSQRLAEQFIKNVSEETSEEEEYRKLIADMLDIFSFENTYKLSMLERDKYELVLKNVLGSKEYEIYEAWKAMSSAGNISDFRNWLKLEYEKTDNSVKIRIPSKALASGEETKAADRVKYEEDSSICEGAKIIYKNKLYDYSI